MTVRNQLLPNDTGWLAEGLSSPVADPLWMAFRQWTVGELTAENAGTPVHARVEIERRTLDTAGGPLETRIEAESLANNFRVAAEVGRIVVDWLRSNARDAEIAPLIASFTLAPPLGLAPTDQLRARLWVATVPNGLRLLSDASVAADIRAVASAWLARTHGPEATSAWVPAELAYTAAVEAEGIRLEVGAWPGGELAPSDFTFVGDAAEKGLVDNTLHLTPARVSFPGMPDRRWWAFEDAVVWFGDPAVDLDRVPQLAVAEFAVVWGDDWFVVPVPTPRGCVVRVARVVCVDSFGVRTRIPSSQAADAIRDRSARFGLWELEGAPVPSTPDDPGPWLLVLPPLGPVQEGEPVEEVTVLRDEDANLAWAVEARTEGPVVGEGQRRDDGQPAPAAVDLGAATWSLATRVPDRWRPLVPRWQEGALVPTMEHVVGSVVGQTATEPWGRILGDLGETAIREEVIRGGPFTVARRWQRARLPGGGSVTWLGRERAQSRVHEGPGLRFDEVDPDRSSGS